MAVKKPRVPRTRNAGTMTEAGFWSMIRSALRQKSRWWKPIAECKKLARRKSKSKNKPIEEIKIFCEKEVTKKIDK